MTFKKQHAKVVRVEVSIGEGDSDRTIEEFERAIRAALKSTKVKAHNVTVLGGYYIIDGQVCMPADYDPADQDRKPGTYPPSWAGGPPASKVQPVAVVEDDSQQEFVLPVKASPYKRRDPLTGVKARKPRSDKGVPRGPRAANAEGLKESA